MQSDDQCLSERKQPELGWRTSKTIKITAAIFVGLSPACLAFFQVPHLTFFNSPIELLISCILWIFAGMLLSRNIAFREAGSARLFGISAVLILACLHFVGLFVFAWLSMRNFKLDLFIPSELVKEIMRHFTRQ